MSFDFTYNIAQILFRSLREELTPGEEAILNNWLNSSEKNQLLYQKIQNDLFIEKELSLWIKNQERNKALWTKIHNNKNRKSNRTLLYILSLSSAAIIIITFGLFFLYKQIPVNQEILTAENVVPGMTKAILLLDDGTEIMITDSIFIPITGVKKGSSKLEYFENGNEEIYHTIKIPIGGEYQIKLADGTSVFLNSESSLKYPVSFGGETRTVTLTGEAFFDVHSDKTKPFIINSFNMKIEVLGTSFNVNTYNPDCFQTAVVTGKVAVHGENNKQWEVTPDHILNFYPEKNNADILETDIWTYIAWKDGQFSFKNESLHQIMETLSRWYDIEVEFKQESIKNLHFTGDIKRHAEINIILNALTSVIDINYQLNGRKLILFKE